MTVDDRLPDAQTLLREFVREKLNGNLDNFRDFDFETLKEDTRFGTADPKQFDGDNTFIIRAVYVLLWCEVFPKMTDWRAIGTGKSYRGDTIHTFHTIFGRADPDAPGHFYGIDRFAPVDAALYDRIRRFWKKMCTLGNYVVLPNAAATDKGNTVTLNTYRGTNRWRDYFDQFLLALEPCLSSGSRDDATLYELVHGGNAPAFAAYRGPGGFTHLVKALLLDDYLDDAGHAKNLFADANGKVRFHWERPQPEREVYFKGVENFLDRAERIISRRTDRMIERLRPFC